jgi:hypothetical protein
MRKLFLCSSTALLLATGTAHKSAQAGYFGEDKWITNCRYDIIEKHVPKMVNILTIGLWLSHHKTYRFLKEK